MRARRRAPSLADPKRPAGSRGHPLKGEAGDSYEYVAPSQERLFSSAVRALARARGTYKVAVQTVK